jgi:hypothetical protein
MKIPSIYYYHSQKLKYFDKLYKSIEIKKAKYKVLIKKNEIDKANELKDIIKKIESKEEETEYFLSVANILNDYELAYDSNNTETNNIGKFIEETINHDRIRLINEYLSVTGNIHDTIKLNNKLMCSECENKDDFIEELSFLICRICGSIISQNLETTTSYKEVQDREYVSKFQYERINHFNDWLSQFQAKENTTIPKEILEIILNELKIERKTIMELKPSHVTKYLKKNGKSKFNEHKYHIHSLITGITPLQVTQQTEELFRKMFRDIQPSFEKHKPEDRKNFLSYSYTIHKFCQLLELDDFLPLFPLLKDRQKLHKHDIIWKKICGDMKWEFYPSL